MSQNQFPRFRVVAAALLGWTLLSPPAKADTGQTVAATFYPLLMHGELIGCQVSFSVLRRDDEFSRGRMTRANGLLVVYGPRAERMGAMLRLGITEAGADNFQPPERAFLLAGFRSNREEAGTSFLSDTPGFRSFPYALGEVSVEAIFVLGIDGTLDLAYGPPGTSIDARIRIDLRNDPEVLQQWGQCLSLALRE